MRGNGRCDTGPLHALGVLLGGIERGLQRKAGG